MSFNAIPLKDFHNREPELAALRRLATDTMLPGGRNLLLIGGRGIGKTELLKQTCRSLYWDGQDIIPFYYRFRRATLKGPHFARDFLSRFLSQMLAFADPSFIDNPGRPLGELFTFLAGSPLRRLSDLAISVESQLGGRDFPFELISVLSAPSVAAEQMGKRILVALDDFHLAPLLFASSPGDSPGIESVFEDALRSPFCAHVLSGSSDDSLSSVFTDDALLGMAERLYLGPIPEDNAFTMLSSLAEPMGIEVTAECRGLMGALYGNPLYIRGLARSFQQLQRSRVLKKDFWECYTHEVSEGQIAFYWTSVLHSGLEDAAQRRVALELLSRTLESPLAARDLHTTARALGLSEETFRPVLRSLELSGAISSRGGIQPIEDTVFRDYVRCAYLREVEAQPHERVRGQLLERHLADDTEGSFSFELTIPMAPDAELVAAKALDQIWTYTGLEKEEAEKLRLALIEACINAMEHSGSYERKISLAFTVSPERLMITVESPGRPFEPLQRELYTEDAPASGRRRGFGLTIMRKIMDEVKVERTADKTRVTLVKNLHQEE